ncbi:hypothetical protein [Wolbachia endosymbiont of Ctenocephalides felis wCfeT]|uniref:hypothetical protein n=1 Tax=Wolbachia endosymbiont of Ctenocephalides felis wCfeT TaxID=2732593 RepID=UPI001448623E|nr:hypothetical protein [Wolbachia endosymbiont of Ctenocephalides felis wCfeT]
MLRGSKKSSISGSSFEVLGSNTHKKSSVSDSSFEILDGNLLSEKIAQSLVEAFEKDVKEIIGKINQNKEIIGLEELWHDVRKSQKVKVEGKDEEIRSPFVTLQAVVESEIASCLGDNTINSAVATIHTPTPATPLRSEALTPLTSLTKAKVEKGLVTKEIENDPKRLKTVTDRTTIVREYLDAGGKLFSAYSTDKDSQGNELTGMNVFRNCLEQYKPNLRAVQLKSFEQKYTGATYIFGNSNEDNQVFSLKAYQANQEELGNKKWCVWFGSIPVQLKESSAASSDKVEKRFAKINNFLLENGNIDMVKTLNDSRKPESSLSDLDTVQHSLSSVSIGH